jgi:hypothetical protein
LTRYSWSSFLDWMPASSSSAQVPTHQEVDALFRAQRPLVAPFLEPFLIRDLAELVLDYF